MNHLPPSQKRKYPFVFLDEVLFYLGETREDQLIQGILTLNGRLDFVRLQRAVRLSLDAEPILGCRLIDHPMTPWWESREDLDGLENCRLVQTEDPERSIDAFLAKSLDPFRDPLIEVCVFRKSEDILVVKVNHLIMDSAGSRQYLYLLADLYGRLKQDPDFKPSANLAGTRNLRQVSRQVTLLQKAGIIRRSLRDLKPDTFSLLGKIRSVAGRIGEPSRPAGSVWGLPLKHGNSNDRICILRKIPAHLVGRLKEYARFHGATLNDALLTAFCRAIQEEFVPHPKESIRITTTADLRRYLPGQRADALCNLSGYVHVNLGRQLGTSFPETLLRVRDRMLSYKADCIGLGDLPLWVPFFKSIPFCIMKKFARSDRDAMVRGKVNPIPCFSNVGSIRSDLLQFDGVEVMDACLIGPIGYAPAFTVGVSGFQGSLTWMAGICNAAENGPILKRLFDGMEKEILSALSCRDHSASGD